MIITLKTITSYDYHNLDDVIRKWNRRSKQIERIVKIKNIIDLNTINKTV